MGALRGVHEERTHSQQKNEAHTSPKAGTSQGQRDPLSAAPLRPEGDFSADGQASSPPEPWARSHPTPQARLTAHTKFQPAHCPPGRPRGQNHRTWRWREKPGVLSLPGPGAEARSRWQAALCDCRPPGGPQGGRRTHPPPRGAQPRPRPPAPEEKLPPDAPGSAAQRQLPGGGATWPDTQDRGSGADHRGQELPRRRGRRPSETGREVRAWGQGQGQPRSFPTSPRVCGTLGRVGGSRQCSCVAQTRSPPGPRWCHSEAAGEAIHTPLRKDSAPVRPLLSEPAGGSFGPPRWV